MFCNFLSVCVCLTPSLLSNKRENVNTYLWKKHLLLMYLSFNTIIISQKMFSFCIILYAIYVFTFVINDIWIIINMFFSNKKKNENMCVNEIITFLTEVTNPPRRALIITWTTDIVTTTTCVTGVAVDTHLRTVVSKISNRASWHGPNM